MWKCDTAEVNATLVVVCSWVIDDSPSIVALLSFKPKNLVLYSPLMLSVVYGNMGVGSGTCVAVVVGGYFLRLCRRHRHHHHRRCHRLLFPHK